MKFITKPENQSFKLLFDYFEMSSQIIQDYNKTAECIHNLPLALQKCIFYFIPLTSIRTNEAKLINNIINIYGMDHDPVLTNYTKKYYIKNILSFSSYVFNTIHRKQYDGCIYGREEYDTLDYQW
jgi:hypothetical protein